MAKKKLKEHRIQRDWCKGCGWFHKKVLHAGDQAGWIGLHGMAFGRRTTD